MMNRVQVQLDEALHGQLRAIANRKRISVSEVVRRLVRASIRAGELDAPPDEKTRGAAAMLELSGVGNSGLRDLGRNHDRYLAAAFDGDAGTTDP